MVIQALRVRLLLTILLSTLLLFFPLFSRLTEKSGGCGAFLKLLPLTGQHFQCTNLSTTHFNTIFYLLSSQKCLMSTTSMQNYKVAYKTYLRISEKNWHGTYHAEKRDFEHVLWRIND